MNDNQKQKQVSLAGAAAGKRRAVKTVNKKRLLLISLPVFLVVVLLVVLLARGCGEDGPSLTARETIGFTATPDELTSKVSYYALGVLGEESTDRMDMIAVLCYDRKADKVAVMQMPVSTYVGETGDFATVTYGDVWANPKSIVWCDTCRGSVAAEEVSADLHITCGTKLTTRKGSAFNDFVRVLNTQYGLPIDNYLVIPRAGLVKLIDAVGGVDIALDSNVTLDGIAYEKGVRTLPGAAAVEYAVSYGYKNTPDTDRARMLRQRQLWAGLIDRLSGYKTDDLYNTDPTRMDVLSNVMLGAAPIRYDTTSFGKARLTGSSEAKAENTKYITALAEWIYDITHVEDTDFTFFTMPGVTQRRGTAYVYSVNKAQTISLLNEHMNPYKLTLDETTVTVPELLQVQQEIETGVTTLDQLVVKAEVSAQP